MWLNFVCPFGTFLLAQSRWRGHINYVCKCMMCHPIGETSFGTSLTKRLLSYQLDNLFWLTYSSIWCLCCCVKEQSTALELPLLDTIWMRCSVIIQELTDGISCQNQDIVWVSYTWYMINWPFLEEEILLPISITTRLPPITAKQTAGIAIFQTCYITETDQE